MRSYLALTFALLIASLLTATSSTHAVTITGGTGPGGFELTGGGSSDLRLWFRGDDVDGLGNASLTGGDAVSTWVNSAIPGAHNALVGLNVAPEFQTTPALNGNSVVFFDGQATLDRELVTDFDVANGDDYTVLVVADRAPGADMTNGSCCNAIVSAGEGLHRSNVLFLDNPAASSGANINYLGYSNADADPGTTGFNDGSSHILAQRYDDTASEISGFYDGDQFGPVVVNGTGIGGDFRIGGESNNSSRNHFGLIAEVAHFNRALNSVERQVAENYLSAKFDLALSSGDVYLGDDGGNGDYDRDVFGVGRVDTDNQLTSAGSAGFGIEATGGLDDGDFLLAGHKVIDNGLTSADVPAGEASRWERVWYLDATDPGTDLASTLAFDFSDAGLTDPGLILSAQLLYSSTQGPFSFSNLLSATSINGDLVTFALPGNLLSDGYYTLAFTAQPIPEPSSFLLLALGCCGLLVRRRRRRIDRYAPAVRSISPQAASLGKRQHITAAVVSSGILVFSLAPCAEAVPITDGLVLHYRFDETVGTTATDASINGFDGTLSGAGFAFDTGGASGGTIGTTHMVGTGALRFDGVNDFVDVGDLAAIDASPAAVSVSMWFNVDVLPTDAGSRQVLLAKYSASDSTRQFEVMLGHAGSGNFDSASWNVQENATPYSSAADLESSTIAASTWYHLAAVYQGGAAVGSRFMRVYINGSLATTLTGSAVPADFTDTDEPLLIGADNDGSGFLFDGLIDDVGVWSRTLTAADVSTIYNNGLSGLDLQFSPPIPEPSTFLLLGLGMFGLARHTRRPKQRA